MPRTKLGSKLIITIVKKEKAKSIVQATKKAGAKGGTTLLGNGFRADEKMRFMGIPVEREREVIFTLVNDDIYSNVLDAIITTAKLNKQKQGIAFVLNTKNVTGICHMIGIDIEDDSDEEASITMNEGKILYDLVITIVNKGDSEKVVDASKKAGAEGGTIINGRGTGIHEQAKLFNILIEPEKEVVLTLITRDKTEAVLDAINKDAELNTPGKGIAFVLEVEKTVGINHLLNNVVSEKMNEK
ncbi:P-II family nitrogen regulator [Paucisalibacillus sp. EB02]|uniref:P-II family nitrogen regulator n=1 Tax=Paucisalibacillus sp. EB02 TaxID=1347087 RepID=UPI0004B8ED27|nr:P-II family nitrogen regulator [Paucisalibacillus sp. EB02]